MSINLVYPANVIIILSLETRNLSGSQWSQRHAVLAYDAPRYLNVIGLSIVLLTESLPSICSYSRMETLWDKSTLSVG